MTVRECAIVEAYTGIVMLAGDKREHLYKYAEELLGEPVYTHYFMSNAFMLKLKKKAEKDFIDLCINSEVEEWKKK